MVDRHRYGAALNTANVEEGSNVAVFGLGAVGLGVIQGAAERKAGNILDFYSYSYFFKFLPLISFVSFSSSFSSQISLINTHILLSLSHLLILLLPSLSPSFPPSVLWY